MVVRATLAHVCWLIVANLHLQVHSRAGLKNAVEAYLGVVPLHADTSRCSLIQSVVRRPRPTFATQDDWEMAMAMRDPLQWPEPSPDGTPPWVQHLPDLPRFTDKLLALHLFLTRYGVKERSYLPVASRGRKYTYLDNKIAERLLVQHGIKPVRSPAAGVSTSLGDTIGLDSRSFNRIRGKLRRKLRKELYHTRRSLAPGPRKRRLRHLESKWARQDHTHGRLPDDVRIDSMETDGVGLRLCIKQPDDMTPFIKPLPQTPLADAPRTRGSKMKAVVHTGSACAPSEVPAGQLPVFSALDTGRAKPYVAAVSRNGQDGGAAETVVFTRRRHRYEIRDRARSKWERARLVARPFVEQAHAALADSGGLRNCDHGIWTAFLAAQQPLDAALDAEFVLDKDRAVWRMRMFRWKRASLDRAANACISPAIRGTPITRPLVFAVGAAGFASGGPGELSSPTAQLTRALERGLKRVERSGRRVVRLSPDEFRTTMCCCCCGAVTEAPMVWSRATRGSEAVWRRSRRLRLCTECEPAGKLRDRDVQGARNILKCAVSLYYGLERPAYMRRPCRTLPV